MSPELRPPVRTDASTTDDRPFPYDGDDGSALPRPTAAVALRPLDPAAPSGAPGSLACPACGNEPVNGAGLFACPDCEWTGTLR